MEFLVAITITFPPDLGDSVKADLLEREAKRGRELLESGTIVRIWRIPGRTANVGIWQAADATELHAALTSLPLFPLASIDVTALATHYLEQDRDRAG
jgi:muconolactone D-isomerase